jgi:hypothetical protein
MKTIFTKSILIVMSLLTHQLSAECNGTISKINPIKTNSSCYCAISSTANSGTDIGNVTFGTYSNGIATPTLGNASASNIYTDFSTSSSIPIFIGVSTSLSISAISSSTFVGTNVYCKVYIDYNHDCTFDPVLELVYSGSTSLSSPTLSTNISVPSTALTGSTGMRVLMYEDGFFSPIIGPCGAQFTYISGEAEDYTLNIQNSNGCSGTPVAGTTIASSNNVCIGNVVNFSLQGNTSSTGLKYQWQENGTNLLNDTNATLSVTIAGANIYQCIVTCTASGLSSTSTPFTIALNPFLTCYCPITATSNSGADIGNVTVGSFSNGNAAPILGNTTANNIYTNFTSLTPIPLFSGAANNIQITGITNSTVSGTAIFGKVYIDYNQDGVYDPINELAVNGTGSLSSTISATISGNPTIPSTALTGTTGMRVLLYENGFSAPVIGPCGAQFNYIGGETEDYLVNIQASTLCTGAPSAGITIASDTTVCNGNTITLSLVGNTTGSGLSYQWQENGINLVGDTNATLSLIVNGANAYQCVITCNASGGSATSIPVNLTLNPFLSCYCAITATSNSGADIGNVTIGAFSNGTASPITGNTSANNIYSSFTILPPIPMFTGTANSIKFTGITASTFTGTTFFGKVYIDYNQDGVYDPINELAVTGTGDFNSVASATISGNPIIPVSALTGVTGMRVLLYESGFSNPIIGPCGAQFNSIGGETEDYLVDIQVSTLCTGTPNAGLTLASDTTVCNGNTVTLNLVGNTTGSGLSYQWQENGINLIGDTNAILLLNVNGANIYQCLITCLATGNSSTSVPVSLTLNPFLGCYCAIASTSNSGTDIGNVTIGTFSNGSASPITGNTSANNIYSNFTTLTPIPLYSGTINNIQFTGITNTTFASISIFGKVYIDYNHDGQYDPINELAVTGTGSFNSISAATIVGNPFIPASALTGITGMRVLLYEAGMSNPIIGPCGASLPFMSGETEDYLVDISIFNSLSKKNDLDNVEINVFPNPTKGILNFKYSKNVKNASICIYDLLGRNLLKENINNSNSIDLSHFNNGTYKIIFNLDGKSIYSNMILNK